MHRLFLTGLFVLLVAGSTAHAAAPRPNIVFIFADDWGWGDLSCHGHPYVKTPNIDRLAREGTDFHRFTVASGVCSPSRTAVLRGIFPHASAFTNTAPIVRMATFLRVSGISR